MQSKADEAPARAGAAPELEGQGRGGENQNDPSRNAPRTAAGIMTLATGQVTTVDRVGTVEAGAESSTWVALYRGSGGAAVADAAVPAVADAPVVHHAAARDTRGKHPDRRADSTNYDCGRCGTQPPQARRNRKPGYRNAAR